MDIRTLLPAPLRARLPRGPKRVAVVRLQGAIGITRPGASGLSDRALAPVLERAFRKGRPDAVALIINSPGGSPVQSSLIAARIRRLADEGGLPVHAFVEDVAASGGYWLACAADDIWADATSVVGSIGVISAGFGLDGFIARHGIERRVHTAGGSKSFLDPFRPEKPQDVARLESLLDDMHQSFRDWVQARRGARLAEGDLFTGEIWTGRQALATGLIDGIAHPVPKLKALYGDKVRLVVHAPRRSLFGRLGAAAGTALGARMTAGGAAGLSGAEGTDMAVPAAHAAQAVLDAVEERALWARYGL